MNRSRYSFWSHLKTSETRTTTCDQLNRFLPKVLNSLASALPWNMLLTGIQMHQSWDSDHLDQSMAVTQVPIPFWAWAICACGIHDIMTSWQRWHPKQEGDPSEVECHHGETPFGGAIFKDGQDREKIEHVGVTWGSIRFVWKNGSPKCVVTHQ